MYIHMFEIVQEIWTGWLQELSHHSTTRIGFLLLIAVAKKCANYAPPPPPPHERPCEFIHIGLVYSG
jgi:hypothetical protein